MPLQPAARRSALLVILIVMWLRGIIAAQSGQTAAPAAAVPELKLETGQQIFEAACIGCHGPGGRGQPQQTLGFEPPPTFPDFSDCNGSTRERTFDWRATIHEGGAGRGFSDIMPSFAEALTLEQIDRVMGYLRSLCSEPQWPLGELNLPRALVTEKAFPEDEVVVTMGANATGSGAFSMDFIYERRFGAKNQLEFAAPVNFASQEGGGWSGGVGDLVFGYKRVLAHQPRTGSIVSVQGEMATPSGNADKGLGAGVTVFETFATVGQILPRFSFVQLQTGGEFPVDTEKAPRAFFVRTAAGKTLTQDRGFGRSWTPMVELIADREFETDAKTNWDIVPQMQVTLNRRQHIRVNFGVRTPLNNTSGRDTQVLFYALWDWFDGGLRDGW